nr:MAG TPA: hypothetical protein [Caudoviricetes sp.]
MIALYGTPVIKSRKIKIISEKPLTFRFYRSIMST